ncbi:MAG: hypothetical protein PVH91_05660 [Pseudomonadales bacterium]|jgi:hypothetical protein
MPGKRLATIVIVCWTALGGTAAWGADTIRSFSGTAPGGTSAFRMDGPWTLSWTAASEFPQLAFLQMQLYDADTDRFLGLVGERDSTGHGERIIPKGGNYRIVVTGQHVDWTIDVAPVSGKVADLLKAHPEIKSIRLVEPETGLSPDLVRGATGWRADGDTAILLTTSTGATVKVPFYGNAACPGLADSHNVFFVTAGYDSELFNAILLENGTRCYLTNPTPLVPGDGADGNSLETKRP